MLAGLIGTVHALPAILVRLLYLPLNASAHIWRAEAHLFLDQAAVSLVSISSEISKFA